MTLPDERYRSIRYARDFLRALLDPKQTPRVPRDIRLRALRVLRHFPHDYEMEKAAENTPSVFAVDK